MLRIIRFIALAIVVVSVAKAAAQEATGPPAWKDGASVYLAMSQKAAGEETTNTAAPVEVAAPIAATPPAAMPAQTNPAEATPAVTSATISTPSTEQAVASPAQHDTRYLAPPSSRVATNRLGASGDQSSHANAASRRLAAFGVPAQSMYTILSALTIVIGAFLTFTWVLKRNNRSLSGRRGQLPADVVSVLGRVPLAARQFAELLRVGNKLVLVSLTQTGVETITEVTDPAEVDRLVGLCQQNSSFSTTKAFEHVFQQMSNEPAPPGFLGNEAMMASLASPAGAYRANRGGARG